VRRATAVVASLKTPSSTTHFARETDQPCRRKSAHCLGKNCVVSSQIVAEFCSAEIGVDGMSHPVGAGRVLGLSDVPLPDALRFASAWLPKELWGIHTSSARSDNGGYVNETASFL
jgi:hypothetical protein